MEIIDLFTHSGEFPENYFADETRLWNTVMLFRKNTEFHTEKLLSQEQQKTFLDFFYKSKAFPLIQLVTWCAIQTPYNKTPQRNWMFQIHPIVVNDVLDIFWKHLHEHPFLNETTREQFLQEKGWEYVR